MMDLQGLDTVIFGTLGLLVGSFLNVVIYRLPVMLEAQWRAEAAEYSDIALPDVEKFNLMTPRSRCQKCHHQIRWFENIPVVSYVFLKGTCAECKTHISPRYPCIELVTGALFAFCAWKWGASATALVWAGFSASLVVLTMIDWDTTLLPDDITLPLMWAGLIAAAVQWNSIPLLDALWGCMAGYLSLWLVYWAFKLATGKEGMGYGDFKLFAALGAWFGWQALIPMILMASIIGAIVGMGMKFSSGLREGGYVPFGPFLAGAGLTAMIFGPQSMMHFIGL